MTAAACASGPDLRGTAVELFCQRAAAAVPGFTVGTAELPAVTGLCRRLDGMPLAIELAAVRLRALPLAELASRLDQPLALLTSGHRGGRHRTLRDSIGWSHDLCTPASRRCGRACPSSPDRSPCGPPRRSAASRASARSCPLVVRLVDKSVLTRVGPAAGGGQPARYLMLGGDPRVRRGAARRGRIGSSQPTRELTRAARGLARRAATGVGSSPGTWPWPSGSATTSSTTTRAACCASCAGSTTTSGPRSGYALGDADGRRGRPAEGRPGPGPDRAARRRACHRAVRLLAGPRPVR